MQFTARHVAAWQSAALVVTSLFLVILLSVLSAFMARQSNQLVALSQSPTSELWMPPTLEVTSAPEIFALMDLNCRLGPGTSYAIDGYLAAGDTAVVLGRASQAGNLWINWWYIQNPTKEGKYCWVWGEATSVEGDPGSVPVIAPTPTPQVTAPCLCGFSKYGCINPECASRIPDEWNCCGRRSGHCRR